MPVQNPKTDPHDSPTYWFAVMEFARERGYFERAAEAKRQLERLGVTVRYDRAKRRRRNARKGAADAP